MSETDQMDELIDNLYYYVNNMRDDSDVKEILDKYKSNESDEFDLFINMLKSCLCTNEESEEKDSFIEDKSEEEKCEVDRKCLEEID